MTTQDIKMTRIWCVAQCLETINPESWGTDDQDSQAKLQEKMLKEKTN